MNSTYDIPSGLSDILGAYDTLHHETVVAELRPNSGILLRGTVLSDSSAQMLAISSPPQSAMRGRFTASCLTQTLTPLKPLAIRV